MSMALQDDDGSSPDEPEYPTNDGAGRDGLQVYVSISLMLLLRDYFAAASRAVFVSSNQFFYYRRGDPRAVVSPDLYVVADESRHPASVPSWKVWEHEGKVPSLALEVVSEEYKKDYRDELIERYTQLGVRELIRYDPGHDGRRGRVLLTHFVRDELGRLELRPSPEDRVQSAVFGFWLVIQRDRSLRLGLGPHGESLWPTADERAAAESEARASAEAAQKAEAAAREAEVAAREAAEAARAAAEAEVSRLRAELARLRGG